MTKRKELNDFEHGLNEGVSLGAAHLAKFISGMEVILDAETSNLIRQVLKICVGGMRELHKEILTERKGQTQPQARAELDEPRGELPESPEKKRKRKELHV